uniref:Uncharacterized protein n=1 Tax=Oryza meridionalis TaxID=40149 RepID=A0A0E0BXD0_9ORYZ
MAAEAWRSRLRERVVEAAERWESVGESLATALTHLKSPMHAGDEEEAAAARTRIRLAMGELVDASRNLASAMSLMKVAELLALHGGSVNPSTRLGEISLLGDQYLAERESSSLKPARTPEKRTSVLTGAAATWMRSSSCWTIRVSLASTTSSRRSSSSPAITSRARSGMRSWAPRGPSAPGRMYPAPTDSVETSYAGFLVGNSF